ncbi:putative WhiB family transcriptional regulator [Actinacidiphila reveromycinica]|uniref:Transcriptional regulator WhiB n=1 Tax=Actinacidiphila reveromycinica TaxID=659352 RepID=A0A7U3UVP2_9ACTN|nr:putative WhiB family transcriptional regulator [Streptomyces sp. SN-593]
MADFSRLPGPNADLWDWQLVAACRGVDSSLFFHPEGERGAARSAREAAAKEVCMRCPVRAECATHALAVREPYGVWGGLTEDEREAMMGRSRHRAAPDRDDDERERERERDRERRRYERYADVEDAEADEAVADADGDPHGRHDDYDPYDGEPDLDMDPDRDGEPLHIY